MKRNLVLLHGWGVNSRVWDGVLPSLNDVFDVTALDLPGYGSCVEQDAKADLNWVADSVLSRAPESAVWCGWSLGGMVAIAAALRQPDRIEQLALVCTTPKFMKDDQWPHGSSETAMNNLSTQFEKDYEKALARFFLLQLGTAPDARSRSRELANDVLSDSKASWKTLESGLNVLRCTDLRDSLASIQPKTYVIIGTEDRVIPANAGRTLADCIPSATRHEVKSGHVPFVTEPEWFIETLGQLAGVER